MHAMMYTTMATRKKKGGERGLGKASVGHPGLNFLFSDPRKKSPHEEGDEGKDHFSW